jgi:hypothetical protein
VDKVAWAELQVQTSWDRTAGTGKMGQDRSSWTGHLATTGQDK